MKRGIKWLKGWFAEWEINKRVKYSLGSLEYADCALKQQILFGGRLLENNNLFDPFFVGTYLEIFWRNEFCAKIK